MRPLERRISPTALACDRVMEMAGGCFSWQPPIAPEHVAIMEDTSAGQQAAAAIEHVKRTRAPRSPYRADDALDWLWSTVRLVEEG